MKQICKRIGNIELRTRSWKDNESLEIVKWVPNPHYHHEDYVYDEERDCYKSKSTNYCLICKASYETIETCFVISFINYNDGWDVKTYLDSFKEMTEEEQSVHNKLIDYFYSMVKTEKENKGEDEEEVIENPIIENRIVNDRTFATRLLHFLERTTVNDMASEEEQDYLIYVAKKLLAYQKATIYEQSERKYFENLK